MGTAHELAQDVGIWQACAALALPRSSFYRRFPVHARAPITPRPRPAPSRALSGRERAGVLDLLNSERFADQPPRQVYAELLDEGAYLCSVRTMYRLLASAGQVRERRDQLRHPTYQPPQLVATAPNQVWSWDITKLPGPVKWTWFHLYVILDLFSRYVVAYMVATRESDELARRLIEAACTGQQIQPGQLKLHSDRGPSMSSKSVALLLADLGVTKSHSRPRVSNDNPYSEAQFKTLKYRPGFPDRFGSVEDARAVCHDLFAWYNHEHHHSGIGLLTPAAVHHGHADAICAKRDAVLARAYTDHPERFVQRMPSAPRVSPTVWINPPRSIELAQQRDLGRPEPRSSILDDPGAPLVGDSSSQDPSERLRLQLASQ